MQIIGHGFDAERIASIKEQVDSENKNWIEQFCSADERSAADHPPVHYRYYAGRFAAKEAVVKALGTGFAGDITWKGIEILRCDGGAPYVRLNGEVKKFADNLGIADWFISISYTDEMAFASVIAVGL